MQVENLNHKKFLIGPMPMIDAIAERLGLVDLISDAIGNDRYARAIMVLVKNVLVDPAALYRIPKWAGQFSPECLEIEDINDDVIGRALDKLFVADRASLQTKLTIKTIQSFQVDTSTVHNDSTTIKFHGAYKQQSPKAVQLKRGHSKDHRPDLKQLVYNLSVAADGTIPVHFKSHDGNKTDDTLHIETWLCLRGILGKSDFLYVADSKLCTTENMRKIDREGGRFLTIVPKTRSEVKIFYESCWTSEVNWLPLTRVKSTRKADHYDVFQVAEGLYQLAEGFRLYWYRSSEKRQRDEIARTERIEESLAKLEALNTTPKRGPKSEKALLKTAQAILDRYKSHEWINVEVKTKEAEEFKQTSRGKPGPDATYKRSVTRVPYLVVTMNHTGIAKSASTDGTFPLTTNSKLDAKQTLASYKYQPQLEKRFSCMKSDYDVAPVFLKKVERIESIMFICFIADLLAAIIQRQLRKAMEEQGIAKLHTLPEERPSETPTWEQLKRLFTIHSKYELSNRNQVIKVFWDSLTQHQQKVLELLKIPKSAFEPS